MSEQLTALKSATEAGTVEVRIRHVDASEGPTLGWFPLEGLQRILDHLLRWGIYDEDGKTTSNIAGTASGSFRLDSTDVYFEIVIEPEAE